MKIITKYGLCAVMGIMAFNGAVYASCPYKEKFETKKIATANFLSDLAKTCDKVGKAIGAQDQRERQQAACEIVGSLLSLAANVTAQNEKDKAAKAADQTTRLACAIEELTKTLADECSSCTKSMMLDALTLADIQVKVRFNNQEFSENLFARIMPFVERNIVPVVKYLKSQQQTFRDAAIDQNVVRVEDAENLASTPGATSVVDNITDMALEVVDGVMENIDKPNQADIPVLEDGTQLSLEVLSVMASIWHLIESILHQNKNVGLYLKEQAILLSSYMYERIVGEIDENFFAQQNNAELPQKQ
ncbi:hypothetical protein IPF37_05520 [bacterium]|nr:MAG: hypothetical protein IPF37_05520 [bacterium]